MSAPHWKEGAKHAPAHEVYGAIVADNTAEDPGSTSAVVPGIGHLERVQKDGAI